MVGEVGADPTIPEVRDLQSRAVADLLLSHIHLLLSGVLFIDDQASACAYYREGCFQIPISAVGAPSGNRTRDPQIKSLLLYHLSYRSKFWRFLPDLNRELRVLQTAVLPFD